MSHASAELTREALLQFAADRGHVVSPGQLHRWRDQGLVPSPRRVRLSGRRGGTESRYPLSAGLQLVAVARALNDTRSLDVARWQLWWRGFDIAPAYITAQLRAEIDKLVERRDQIRSGDNPDEDEQADRAALEFEQQTRERTADRRVSRLRKRVGRSQFTTLMTVFVQAVVGQYADHDPQQLSRAAGQIGLGPDDQGKFLGALSNLMNSVLAATDLAAVSGEELTAARDSLRDIVQVARTLLGQPAIVEALIGGPLPPAVRDFAPGFRAEEPGPFDLLIWLGLRRKPTAFLPQLGSPQTIEMFINLFALLKTLGAQSPQSHLEET